MESCFLCVVKIEEDCECREFVILIVKSDYVPATRSKYKVFFFLLHNYYWYLLFKALHTNTEMVCIGEEWSWQYSVYKKKKEDNDWA